MSDSPYKRCVTYRFNAVGEVWAALWWSDKLICFEETRKNGQEDTHVYAEVELVDGKWVIDEFGSKQIRLYFGQGTFEALTAFFNEHGPPPIPQDPGTIDN